MAFTIVRVASGGIPVVESENGLPYYEADNGYGIPVTFGSTGIPLGTVGASSFASYPAPSGFRWDFVTFSGERVTYNGQPIVALVSS